MAKKSITQSTVATNNIQSQADQVKSQAAALKLAFDQYGIDSKTYNNTVLISELADESVGNSGSNTIGHNSTNVTADNVGDGLEENALAIQGVVLGAIPDNTLTEAKMAAEMKKQAGGVAEFDTVATDVTNLEILRLAELDTGAADAYVVTTAGTFSRVDGNILHFIPANSNTGASTINEDANGVAAIEKYVDGAWVAIEADNLKKFQQTQLVWNTSRLAFQLAPKDGGMEFYENTNWYTNRTLSAYTSRLNVSGSGWVVSLTNVNGVTDQVRLILDGANIDTIIFDKIIMQRFETSFDLTSNNNYVGIAYILDGTDKSIENGTPKIWSPSTGVATTTRLNVSGEGWLFGVQGDNDLRAIDILIDGVSISGGVGYDKGNGFPMFFKFNSSLEVKSENAGIEISYSLK